MDKTSYSFARHLAECGNIAPSKLRIPRQLASLVAITVLASLVAEASEALVAEREGGATLTTDWFEIFLPSSQLQKMEEGIGEFEGPYKR